MKAGVTYISHFFDPFLLAGFLTILPDMIPIVLLTYANPIACYPSLCAADGSLATFAFRVAPSPSTYTKLLAAGCGVLLWV